MVQLIQSISYLVFFILAGVALFLAFLPHLTTDEKTKVFVVAVVAGPTVALFFNGAFFTWHDAGFASQGNIRGDDSALRLLSWLAGLAASGGILWLARYVSDHRSYQDFVGMQQRLEQAREHARIDAENRRERLLQGHVQLARLQLQERLVAVHQSEVYAQAVERGTALAQAEQKLRLAYSSYCSTVDPLNEQNQTTLLDGFRGEIGRPRFIRGKIDMELLNQSDDPLVKQVLHGRPSIALTPDDQVTP